MKNLSALICSFAVLIFSATAHAAPVQYQITATHTQETTNGSPVNVNDYFFANGTTITATFYYDPTTPAGITNQPTGGSGLFSSYNTSSGYSIEVAGHSLHPNMGAVIIDNDNSSPLFSDAILFVGNTTQLTLGSFELHQIRIAIGGPDDMLSSQSLPQVLTGLNSTLVSIQFDFYAPGESRWVAFENGTISQVPLPSSALFFLSGLIGLGANIFRKANK